MFIVLMTVMPWSEQLLDVLPALLVLRAGRVGVGELVDQGDVRRPPHDGVGVHLLERAPAILDRAAGMISRSPIACSVSGRSYVST